MLVEKDANINFENSEKVTVLEASVKRGHLGMCEYLIGKGAKYDHEHLIKIAHNKGHQNICDFLYNRKIE